MPSQKRRIKKRKSKNKRHRHFLFILLLVVVGTFFVYKEFSREDVRQPGTAKRVHPQETAKKKYKEGLPKIAIVIDDLGPNKNAALRVFDIDASITLSILPQETYTAWIAGEGRRRGFEVIGHIPMEAKTPHKLGKGGLYTWMTDDEIRKTVNQNIDSIPDIRGASSHMGSAFTENERVMSVLLSELSKRRLFFIDSLTNPRSVGSLLAGKYGVKVLKRDIFLDNEISIDSLNTQWERAVNIARKRGYAVVLAHPGKNSIAFLKEAVSTYDIKTVYISELL
jgi:polysaccharide deacetylase 2 family uncharacterized protein YibQ